MKLRPPSSPVAQLVPALIAKRGKGGISFRGADEYDQSKEGSTLLEKNLEGTTPRERAKEIANLRAGSRLKRAVDHWSISLDGRLGRLTDDQWRQVCQDFILQMGYTGCPYVLTRHADTSIDHCHVTVLRLLPDGTVVSDSNDFKRSHEAAARCAAAIGLQPLPPRPDATRLPAPTDSQVSANKRAERRGTKVQNHASLARIFDHIVSKSVDLAELESKLREVDVGLQIFRKSSGSVQGLNVKFVGAEEWLKASGLRTNRSLSWLKVEARLASNLQLRERAQAQAEHIAEAARERAEQRVAARLDRQPDSSVSPPARALPLATIARAKEATMNITDDKLDFLTAPPEPRHVDQRLDDVPMVAASSSRRSTDKREALDRNDRERAAAAAEVEGELQSATKMQLKRLRDALAGELQAHDAEAIELMLARFTRLVLRLLTLNQVVLPPTESERRVHVARHSLNLVDAEIRRRADVEVRRPAVSQPPRVPRAQPAPEKFQIVRAHDPRQPQRDRDDIARELDARRERNRK